MSPIFRGPDEDDFFKAMRAAMADPDFHQQDPDAASFLDRLQGRTPSATTCIPGQPLVTASMTVPTHHDYCNRCGIDLFSNADSVLIRAVLTENIEVQCDCGQIALLPKWLFV